MDVYELVTELESRGATLLCLGDRLRVQPRSAIPQELIPEIVEHKAELLKLLQDEGWPAECLEAERRFGQRHARLFPLLDQTVETPQGPGRLVQVFAERVAVELTHSPGRMAYLLPDEVRPPGVPARSWSAGNVKAH